MKTRNSRFTAIAVAFTGMLGISGPLAAGDIDPPETLTCSFDGTDLFADWSDVDGADKYSVSVTAQYDIDGADGVVDREQEFDFGTGDRTDGAPADQSDLSIPLSALTGTFVDDDTGEVVTADPVSATLKVKGLHPGKGQGRQNAPFSPPCDVTL